jgi:serine protease Do
MINKNLIRTLFSIAIFITLINKTFCSSINSNVNNDSSSRSIICSEMVVELDNKDSIYLVYINKSKFEKKQPKGAMGKVLTYDKSNYLFSLYHTYGKVILNEKQKDPFELMGNAFLDQLVAFNFMDTLNDNFYNYLNSLSILPKLKLWKIHDYSVTKKGGISLELGIEWYVYDLYHNLIDSIYIYDNSPFIQYSYNVIAGKEKATAEEINRYYKNPIKNLAKSNLLKLLNHIDSTKLFPKEELTEFNLKIKKDSTLLNNDLNLNVNSCVTIINKTGHGSGFLISDDGYIVTNYHVINKSQDKLSIILNNGNKYSCKIIRVSKSYDLALLKIDESGLVPLTISNSNIKNIGANVIAIGTPKSVQLGQTISKGIISGYRTLGDINYIQTDISINSGNSGGPILNSNGEVIGIVTAKLFGYGVEGINFALPSKYIFDVLGIEYVNK